MSEKTLHYVTVATRSYLPTIAVLARSLVDAHPEARITCYLAERDSSRADDYKNLFEIVPINKLNIPVLEKFIFQYEKLELCCALKPYAVLHQLEKNEAQAVIYIDSDMKVYSPFQEIIGRSLQHGSVVLTPHLHTPMEPPDYLYILRSGVCNAGFMAFKNNDEAKQMLHWWCMRVKNDCIADPYAGLLYDQRWLDLAVGLFSYIYIERHPGINVAYWNLHEKKIVKRNSVVMVDEKHPLCIFHFSGISGDRLTKYQDEASHAGSDIVLHELVTDYRNEIREMKNYYGEQQVYSYSTFADGSEISPAMREVVRLDMVDTPDPFSDKDRIVKSIPTDESEIWMHRVSYLVNERWKELLKAKAKISQLWNHIVFGRIWRFWRKWINPNI